MSRDSSPAVSRPDHRRATGGASEDEARADQPGLDP